MPNSTEYLRDLRIGARGLNLAGRDHRQRIEIDDRCLARILINDERLAGQRINSDRVGKDVQPSVIVAFTALVVRSTTVTLEVALVCLR